MEMVTGLLGSAVGCAVGTLRIGSQSRRRDAGLEMASAAVGLVLMGVGIVLTVLLGGWGRPEAVLSLGQIFGVGGSVVLVGLGVATCWLTLFFQLLSVLTAAFGDDDAFRPRSDDRWHEDFEQFEKREGGL